MELDEAPLELQAGPPPLVEFAQPVFERKMMKKSASAEQGPGIE